MATLAIGKDTRKRINLIPALTEKVADHEVQIKDIKKFLFVGNVDENIPSLAERMRTIEKTLVNVARLLWLVIGAIIVQIVSNWR